MKTFADAAARYAYYVLPDDVRTEFKQLDTGEVYVATRQGAGAQAWELSYEVGGTVLEDGNYADIEVSESGTRLQLRGVATESGNSTLETGTDQNNYALAANTRVLYVTPTSAFTFTGFSGGQITGRMVALHNIGDLPFFIAHDSAASSAFFNRVYLPNATRLVVRPGDSVWLRQADVYWRPMSVVHEDGYQSLSDDNTVTYDVSLARNGTVTLAGSRVLAFTNVTAGESGYLRIIQDATGSRALTSITVNGSSADVHIPGGTAALATLLHAAANNSDLLGWVYDGTSLLVWNEASTSFSSIDPA